MTSIVSAKIEDVPLLAEMGKVSFIRSHGHSATQDVITEYVTEKYSHDAVRAELVNAAGICNIIYHDHRPAGYSKIVLSVPHANIHATGITKLERLYLLEEFYGQKLGYELLRYNISLSQKKGDTGMWLFVWEGNQRAVRFYKKAGFSVIGSHDFKLTETHSNPNYQMLLTY